MISGLSPKCELYDQTINQSGNPDVSYQLVLERQMSSKGKRPKKANVPERQKSQSGKCLRAALVSVQMANN